MDEGPQAGSHGQDETEDESANFPTFRILIDSFSRIFHLALYFSQYMAQNKMRLLLPVLIFINYL